MPSVTIVSMIPERPPEGSWFTELEGLVAVA